MPPPVAVYVVAAVASIAAIIAFKEFVYEPHIAPKVEAWAEGFLERRRAARSRRASAVSVRTSRHRRDSSSSSVSSLSHHSEVAQRGQGEHDRPPGPIRLPLDEHELEALASKEVDEWRNEVLRSQERTRDGLRKRRTHRPRDEFDGFDSMSTTLDESFTSLTHTPLESTHVISNVSSPITGSTLSLPSTPNRRTRSVSQSTTTQVSASFVHVPSTPIHGARAMSPPGSAVLTPRPSADIMDQPNEASTLAIPILINRQSAADGVPHPLPFTPTYQVMPDDSFFGPIIPDTPRSSAEMYGERPFSPIARVMRPPSPSASKGTSSSMADSMHSVRSLGGSGTSRKRSGLANEVVASTSDGGIDQEQHAHPSSVAVHLGSGVNGSVISSLSERYPAPPTPPIIVSPPASSVGIISPPLSPRSSGSEVVIQHDAPRASLPMLQLPTDASPGLIARSRSAVSPVLSDASFLSPMPVASESEADEFMSVASDDSWASPIHDRPHNPFLDFVHLNERASGSEGSDVFVARGGGASEVGSEESWGSARRH